MSLDKPSRSPEQKDFKKTQLGRTKERIAMLLKNPNLNEQKKERLRSLLKRMQEKKDKLNKTTLSRLNRKVESITGRERIKMMKELISRNYNSIKDGDLTSLPKLFSLLRSDRIPLKHKDLAIYRLKNKLYMKDDQGSYIFELKANQGKWEMWHKGKKLKTTPPKQSEEYKKNPAIATLAPFYGLRERAFYCREQKVTAPKAAPAKSGKSEVDLASTKAKEKAKEVKTFGNMKKIFEDLHKFSETTGSSAGPLPQSLVNYAKKLKSSFSTLSGKYMRKNGKPMEYDVFITSKVVKGKKVFEFVIQTYDKYAAKKVRTEVKRYWPSTNEGKIASYFAPKSRPKTKPAVKPKAKPAQRVAAKSKPDENIRLMKQIGAKKEVKKQQLTANKYRETLQKELSTVLRGLKNPRNLFNRLIEDRADELSSMTRAEKAKVYQQVARTVSKFITSMKNVAKELESGKLKTVAEMNKRYNNALSILPSNSRQKEVYAKRLDRIKKSVA